MEGASEAISRVMARFFFLVMATMFILAAFDVNYLGELDIIMLFIGVGSIAMALEI